MKYGNIKKDNFEIQVNPNETDDFDYLCIINGLYVKDGGAPIDYILQKIIPPIQEKLKRKYKTIKPGDIKNKIKIYVNARFVKNLKFNSQTKEKVTNNVKDFNEVFKGVNWDKIVRQILKDEDIITAITSYFELKEKAKELAELKKIKKTNKKITSDKFYPATKENKYLCITEGASAGGLLQKVLGRKEYAYYELKGVPLNAWEASISKALQNQEIKDLFEILNKYKFEKIIIVTDQDLDGFKITGLLLANFYKLFSEFKDKIYRLNTPIFAKIKNNMPEKWVYDFKEIKNLPDGNKYYKGLASWKGPDLQKIIKTDGLDKMLVKFVFDSENTLNEWYAKEQTDKRKEYIMQTNFDINLI